MEEERKRAGSKDKKEEKKSIEQSNTVELNVIKEEEIIDKNEKNKQDIKDEEPKKEINIESKSKKDIKKKRKIKLTKQSIAVIIIILACIVITVCLIVLKIRNLNEKYNDEEKVSEVFEDESKKEDPDLKFVVGENDTLDYNDLSYETVYVIDGVETTDRSVYQNTYNKATSVYAYIRISGLKDKNVENKINEDIKNTVFNSAITTSDGKSNCIASPAGNYNNIFSVAVIARDNTYTKTKGLNYDLNTGEKFSLEDVFTKSAPLVNILTTAYNKNLAWDIDLSWEGLTDEEYFAKRAELYNMNNRDTSEYEDSVFDVSKWYENNKGNIEFTVSPTVLNVYNVTINDNNYNLTIPLYENSYCVAIYKRFKGQNLFTNDINSEGFIPFSMPMSHYSGCLKDKALDYGMKSDNLFVDICISSYTTKSESDATKKIYESLNVFKQNILLEETKRANSNLSKGYIVQGTMSINDYTSNVNRYDYRVEGYTIPYYMGQIYTDCVEIDLNDFKNLRELLAKAAITPTAAADPVTVRTRLRIENGEDVGYGQSKYYYFDADGNYLGDDIGVVKDTNKPNYNPS